jgi:hypothetical protein
MLVLVSCNALVAICAVTAISLMLGTRIFQEERMLTERFGDAYRDYMRSTGRLLPRLFRSAKPVRPPAEALRVNRERTVPADRPGDPTLPSDASSATIRHKNA